VIYSIQKEGFFTLDSVYIIYSLKIKNIIKKEILYREQENIKKGR